MPVNFNAMIQPQIATSMAIGSAERQKEMLNNQQMANTQQEMQFRGEERAYTNRMRAEDEAYMHQLDAEAQNSGGRLTPEYIMLLAKSRNPQLRATGIEAMTRAQRLVDHNAAIDKLFPKAPTYTPTFGGTQFGGEAPTNYLGASTNKLSLAADNRSPFEAQSPYRTWGEFRGALADPGKATAAMARGMRTIPPELEGLLRNPDTANMAIALLDKQNKGPELQQLHQYAATLDPKSQEYKDVQAAIKLMNSPKMQNIYTPGGQLITASSIGGPATVTGGYSVPPKIETILIDGKPHVVDVNVYQPGSGIGPNVPGYKGEAVPTGAQATATAKQRKNEDSFLALKENLQDFRSAFERLHEKGGMPTTKDGVVANVTNQLANTAVGGMFATAIGSEAQVERTTIENTRRLIIQDLAAITGITSQQLNSNVELQQMMKTLGTPGQSKEAVDATFDAIMRWAETKIRSSRHEDGAAPARPPATGGGAPAGKPTSTAVDTGHPLLNMNK